MKNITALVAGLSISVTTITMNKTMAQTSDDRVYIQRKSFWFEGNLNGSIRRNSRDELVWQYQLDYQYRRGSDASNVANGNHLNGFKDMQQNVVRPWIHFFPVAGKIRLSISPLGHWGSWTPRADGPVKYYHEFRSTYQFTMFYKIGRVELQQRYRYERRWISAKDSAMGGFKDVFSKGGEFYSDLRKNRLRYLVRANIPINKSGSQYISVWNEAFIGFGRNVANNKLFDQNRLVCLYGRKFNQDTYPMKLEVGFLWQVAPKYDLAQYGRQNWESNLALNVYLIFDEFHKFKHKK